MVTTLKRIQAATGTAALVVGLLALVLTASATGYAAGRVGTADLQDGAVTAAKIKKNAVTAEKLAKNSVTSSKVKNGSLQPAEFAPQERQHVPKLGNGGQGDCVWLPGDLLAPGVDVPSYRKDRDGRVILTGVTIRTDGPGGDGDCDHADPGQVSDGIVFTLPAGYVPAKTVYIPTVAGELAIAGAQGTNISGQTVPPGAVFATNLVLLDGIEFDPAGSPVT